MRSLPRGNSFSKDYSEIIAAMGGERPRRTESASGSSGNETGRYQSTEKTERERDAIEGEGRARGQAGRWEDEGKKNRRRMNYRGTSKDETYGSKNRNQSHWLKAARQRDERERKRERERAYLARWLLS